MTLKMTLAALALTLTPALAFAQCNYTKDPRITASACGEGMVWDTTTQTCVDRPSS